MWFWIRHLSFAAVLIALAVYFLVGDGSVFDIKKSKNAAAEGLSRFYSSIRNQVKSNKDQGGNPLGSMRQEQPVRTT